VDRPKMAFPKLEKLGRDLDLMMKKHQETKAQL
jgi:hypothetical protein